MERYVEYWLAQSDKDILVAESMLADGHYRSLKEMRAWIKKVFS